MVDQLRKISEDEQLVIAMQYSSYQKQQSINARHGYKSRLFPHWVKCVHNGSCSKFLPSFTTFLYCHKRVTFTWKKLCLVTLL